jgi:hypothetical protein
VQKALLPVEIPPVIPIAGMILETLDVEQLGEKLSRATAG